MTFHLLTIHPLSVTPFCDFNSSSVTDFINMYYSTPRSIPSDPLLESREYYISIFHVHDAANAVTLLHVFKCLVDVFKGLAVGDELVHLQLALHVVINQVRKLGAAFDAPKGTSLRSR